MTVGWNTARSPSPLSLPPRAARCRAAFHGLLVVTLGLALAQCRSNEPDTPEARYKRGLEIVNAAGQHVAAAQSFRLTTHEEGERVRRSGEKEPVTINQVVEVRRPDRLHIKASGGRDLEVFYDGKQVTLVTHQDKVYGVVPATGTLQELITHTMDRFDIPFPVGDLITFTSAERLVNEDTTGGWVGEETLDGTRVDKVAWQHPNIDWTIWVAKEGPPLVKRFEIDYKGRRGSPKRVYELRDFSPGVDIPDATFVANVPADYEGIPVIQRASSVLGDNPQPSAETGKPAEKKE